MIPQPKIPKPSDELIRAALICQMPVSEIKTLSHDEREKASELLFAYYKSSPDEYLEEVLATRRTTNKNGPIYAKLAYASAQILASALAWEKYEKEILYSFLKKHIKIDDVGDEESCPGIVIYGKSLAEALQTVLYNKNPDAYNWREEVWGSDISDLLVRAAIDAEGKTT